MDTSKPKLIRDYIKLSPERKRFIRRCVANAIYQNKPYYDNSIEISLIKHMWENRVKQPDNKVDQAIHENNIMLAIWQLYNEYKDSKNDSPTMD